MTNAKPEQKIHDRARLTLPKGWLYQRIESQQTGLPDVYLKTPCWEGWIEAKADTLFSQEQINWWIPYLHLGGKGFCLTQADILPVKSGGKIIRNEPILWELDEEMMWSESINGILKGKSHGVTRKECLLWDEWITEQKGIYNKIKRADRELSETTLAKDDLEEMIAWLAEQDSKR